MPPILQDYKRPQFGTWPKGWYVFHEGCEYSWCRGDYGSKEAADGAVPGLVASGNGTCPGCDLSTPHNGHYTVRQVTE